MSNIEKHTNCHIIQIENLEDLLQQLEGFKNPTEVDETQSKLMNSIAINVVKKSKRSIK